MTAFERGDLVTPTAAAQGLVLGEVYQVTGVAVQSTPFGGFATYSIARLEPVLASGVAGDYTLTRMRPVDPVLQIGNGHLVLRRLTRLL